MVWTSRAGFDCLFLSVVMAISLVPFIGRLGFYYDDYSALDRMAASHDQSIAGLFHAVRPAWGQRPLAALLSAVLYRFFGADPLGYHVVNACLLIAVALLLYLVLRELRLPRLVAVALPVVFSMMPHYASDRFWPDLIDISLSNALYLLSLYAGLRAVRSSLPSLAAWLALVVGGIGVIMFTYELFIPLFAVNVLLCWWAARRVADGSRRHSFALTAATIVVTLAATGITKAIAVAEHGQNGYQVGLQNGLLHHLAYLVAGGVKLNFGTYLFAFPYVLGWIVWHEFSITSAVVSVVIGALTFVYLWHIGGRQGESLKVGREVWRGFIGLGLLAFVLGYSIFITTDKILFRSAGIDNRVNVAAALGLAAMLIGGVGWAATRLRPDRALVAFCGAVACVAASGVFVIQALGSYWVRAADRQDAIVAGLTREAGAVRPSTTFILDGSCPEIGPAVVFADQWDLRGRLQLAYRDPSLKADVASESMQASAGGLSIRMSFLHRVFWRTYPYGPRLLVYDASKRHLYRITDRNAAERYVARSRPSFSCPPQRSFAWGFDPMRRLGLL
jgi:hypothetical protein